MSIETQLIEISNNVPKVYNAGYEKGKAEGGNDSYYDAFWDAYQDNGTRTNYKYAFYSSGWKNANYNPKYPLTGITVATSMFTGSRMTKITTPLDLSACTDCSLMFSQCYYLATISKIDFGTKITNANNMFASCGALKTITEVEGTINTSISLGGCPLDKDTIKRIYDALSTTATGKTLTLKKTAVNAAFTDEEWKALTDAKDNWTYTLHEA